MARSRIFLDFKCCPLFVLKYWQAGEERNAQAQFEKMGNAQSVLQVNFSLE
jgi:hypothetical protein